MLSLLSDNFKPLEVTKTDLVIASVAWGFTLGFGFLTTWTAYKQTAEVASRYGFSKIHSPYIVMIWLEILVCLIFCIICWLHLNGNIPPSFAFFFVILTTWALQVQFLLQIIINRVSILLTDRRKAKWIKISVAVLITAINISVYCIWIPARLQISEEYIRLNDIWDRCEKCIYLVVDAALNFYFIRIVKQNLVRKGLIKYDRLVRFNKFIVGVSLSMDCMIIGMMSLNNGFLYMQFHPVAYMVKLKIEMSMAEMIVKIASDKNNNAYSVVDLHHNPIATQLTKTFGTSKDVNWRMEAVTTGASAPMNDITFNARREVHVTVERRKSLGSSSTNMWKDNNYEKRSFEGSEEDTKPLKDKSVDQQQREDSEHFSRLDKGMGMTVKIWGPPEGSPV